MTAYCRHCCMLGMQVHTEQSLANVVKSDMSACQVSTLQTITCLYKQRQEQLLSRMSAHCDIQRNMLVLVSSTVAC